MAELGLNQILGSCIETDKPPARGAHAGQCQESSVLLVHQAPGLGSCVCQAARGHGWVSSRDGRRWEPGTTTTPKASLHGCWGQTHISHGDCSPQE